MSPKHTNPSYDKPREDSKTGDITRAHAPYNFVPLPEMVVNAPPVPDQDVYEGLTGWLECEFVTKSPTYIRGMLNKKRQAELSSKKAEGLKDEDKEEMSHFFSYQNTPVIPGSSLRGMLRTMVEIVSFGKMRWVASEPTFTFRAFAAKGKDPLKDPYTSVMGNGSKPGYLEKRGEDWIIRPALTPTKAIGKSTKGDYYKISEKEIKVSNFPGLELLNDENYKPGFYPINFDITDKGKIVNVNVAGSGLPYNGVLVCSGNMMETGNKTERKKHSIIFEVNTGAKEIPIPQSSVTAYLNGMTVYQKEIISTAWDSGGQGVLADGAPVFYKKLSDDLVFFGHSPNFRIPAWLEGANRPATPADFVPQELTDDAVIDFADSLFGWAPEPGRTRRTSRAGRVFVEDAKLVDDEKDIWYSPNQSITPHVLSSPKPTTFQHYLVQDKDRGHDPDVKEKLAHFGTSPLRTQIRGYKMYWHKGDTLDLQATKDELSHSTQLTRIRPLNSGVRFTFKLHFENLSEAELGALLWALQPSGVENEMYVHNIGMGKSLGMGSIYFGKVNVHLTDRKDRYSKLFASPEAKSWHLGTADSDVDYIEQFEGHVLNQLRASEQVSEHAKRLLHLDRIQELLTMMRWQDEVFGEAWNEMTSYMQIEAMPGKINEYKERPVLPNPRGVFGWFQNQSSDKKEEKKEEIEDVDPFAVGSIIWAKVHSFEPDGTVWAEPENVERGSELLCRILPENLHGKKYQEGQRIRLAILSKVDEDLLDCMPANVARN